MNELTDGFEKLLTLFAKVLDKNEKRVSRLRAARQNRR